MAVKAIPANKRELQIRDYWRNYQRTARIIVISTQIIVTLIVGLSLLINGADPLGMAFGLTMLATIVTSSLLNFFILDFLLTPLRDLAMAITNASGQKPTEPLANPNATRYDKNGFKKLLQFVYENTKTELYNDPDKQDSSKAIQIETALNQTSAGVIIMDSSGNIQYSNRAAPTASDTKGKEQLELLFDNPRAFTDWLENCRETAVRSTQNWARVANKVVGNDDRRIFNITANYEKGSPAEVVIITYDTTDTYQPEDDELDFISFAAHELRGPITVIRGYLDVLEAELDSKLAPDQHELFKRLTVSANRLSSYINNILNTSKYDRRHLQVHLTEQTLQSIYNTISDDMALRAQSQRRLLAVNIPQDLPTIAADKSSLSEVISNLIDNALKYSNDGGSVNLVAEVDGDFIKVSVSDNGIGIPTSVIGNLFHKFYRSHRSRETVAGTGIGLYICKAIIESHGGKIGVSSIEGQGATFYFTVPIYSTVANKLQASNNLNDGLITSGEGWIKNHSKFTG